MLCFILSIFNCRQEYRKADGEVSRKVLYLLVNGNKLEIKTYFRFVFVGDQIEIGIFLGKKMFWR